jgi:hypothetical protein
MARVKPKILWLYAASVGILVAFSWWVSRRAAIKEGYQDVTGEMNLNQNKDQTCVTLFKQRDSFTQQLEEFKKAVNVSMTKVMTGAVEQIEKKISDLNCNSIKDSLPPPPTLPTPEEVAAYEASKKASTTASGSTSK